ncbi:MAG: TadE/TadG family type IV pilus assembly protein [Gemmata sp.]
MSRSTLTARRVVTRTRGASYSLPFVLVVPIYLMFIIGAIEVAFLMLARIGTQYAAHAAARSAVVWRGAKPAHLRDQRPHQSAAAALAAFVGGRERELETAGPAPAWAAQLGDEFATATQTFAAPAAADDPAIPRPYQRSRTPPDADFLRRKYQIAAARSKVEVKAVEPNNPRTPLTVTVTFRAPLYMPVVSRFLDPDKRAPYEYPLSAAVTMAADGAVTKDGQMTVEYHSFPLKK